MSTVTSTGLATTFNWTVQQGELVVLNIPVLDSAGAPFIVTGWSVDAKVKTGSGGATLHTWAIGDITVTGSTVQLRVLPATSLAWAFEQGFWRTKIIHPSDPTQIYRIIQGNFSVSDD